MTSSTGINSLVTEKLNSSEILPHRYASIFQRIRVLDSTTFQLPELLLLCIKVQEVVAIQLA